jgi:RNA polymerase sigma factor (sigma-70 family)
MDSEPQQAERDSVAAEVRRFREDDAAAAEVLARRALRLALRTAAALLRSREEASDVAQDVAVDVLRSLNKLRDPEAFDAWVHRITVRHALRRLKRGRRAREVEAPLALLAERDQPAADMHADIDSLLAARQGLAVALSKLAPRQRLALALRYVHDLSDAEIAAALGCRTGTVHALLSRGRNSLRADTQLLELALELKGG